MSGAAGHLNHLYDNKSLTFRKLKKILSLASQGKLIGTEKIDGFNVYFSFRDNNVVVARNKTDIRSGGQDLETLNQRIFKGGDEVKEIYLSTVQSLQEIFNKIPKKVKNEIFQNGKIFYNAEIFGPSAKNIVDYDYDMLSVHQNGHLSYDDSTKTIVPMNDEGILKILEQILEKIEKTEQKTPVKIKKQDVLKLNPLENKNDFQIAKSRINKIINTIGLSDGNTIEDYLKKIVTPKIQKLLPEVSEEILNIVINNVLGIEKLSSLPKGLPQELRKRISEIKKLSKKWLEEAIFPLEETVHDFSVELLQNLHSAYISDNSEEVKKLRSELSKAIKTIRTSGNEKAITILHKQLKKIKNHNNINTATEGFVFTFDGETYKFTGNFAPINQILNLFRYGRGKEIPPMLVEEDKNVKIIAAIPGSFKPPHAGHYEMANYFANMPEIDLVYVLISPKERMGHSADKEIRIDGKKALSIWKIYTKQNPKFKLEVSKQPSPVRATYDFMENLNPGDTLILVQGEKQNKDDSDKRFEQAQEWADKNGYNINVQIASVPLLGKGISGTEMREFIAEKDYENFIKFLPSHLSEKEIKKIWSILLPEEQNLQEKMEYQEKIKKHHSKYKKRLIGHGGQEADVADSPYTEEPDMERSKSAPPIGEMSSMSGGSIEGAPVNNDDENDEENIIRDETKQKWGHLMKDRNIFLQELKLREQIRKIIKKKNEKKYLNEQLVNIKLKDHIKQILKEVDDEVPHRSTGINILEELLKKILPLIETDYKTLTTSYTQRKSYRAHIVKAIKSSLLSAKIRDDAGKRQTDVEYIPIKEQEDLSIKIGDKASEGEEKPEEKEEFIDIDKDSSKNKAKKEFIDDFSIPGEDTTGRNMAISTFDRIEQNILDSFAILSNEEDEELFYSYLLTNVKLYLDKYEDELKINVEEPTTVAYKQEKAKNI